MENSLKMFIELGFHLKAIGTLYVGQNITTSLSWKIPLEIFHFSVKHAYLLICVHPPKGLLKNLVSTSKILTTLLTPLRILCSMHISSVPPIKQLPYWGTSLDMLLALETCFYIMNCCRRRPLGKTLVTLFLHVFCCQHHMNGIVNQLLFQFLKYKTIQTKPVLLTVHCCVMATSMRAKRGLVQIPAKHHQKMPYI